MPTFKLRVSVAHGGRQHPAREVSVEAPTWQGAVVALAERYARRGRTARAYMVEIDGVWRKIEWTTESGGATLYGASEDRVNVALHHPRAELV